MAMPGDHLDEMIDMINDSGAGVIGTPEQARAQVQRLWDKSGGFGCMLQMGHEWANPAATKRSAELFAAEVMPHFQGQAQPTLDAAARAGQMREGLAQSQPGRRAHDQEVSGRNRFEIATLGFKSARISAALIRSHGQVPPVATASQVRVRAIRLPTSSSQTIAHT